MKNKLLKGGGKNEMQCSLADSSECVGPTQHGIKKK
jgi:hypothetical protein